VRRALEYLHPDNVGFRTSTVRRLGYAHQFQRNRAAAGKAYAEAVATSRASGNTITEILASIGVGNIQEGDNQLHPAAETYARVVRLAADLPFPVVSEAHLGLARIRYQWNDLEAAERHWQQSLQLARQLEHTDRAVVCEVFHARLQLARGDVAGATQPRRRKYGRRSKGRRGRGNTVHHCDRHQHLGHRAVATASE